MLPPEHAVASRVVHIEGMDLAGKSTLTAGLVDALPGARLARNSLLEHNPVYDVADELRRNDAASGDVLGWLYVAALTYDLERYREPQTPTVQDSTILLRSLAYYEQRGDRELIREFRRLAARHPRFGVTFVLTANRKARLARLESRRRKAAWEVAPDDLLVERDSDRFFAMEAVLVELARELFAATVVDTSALTPREVLNVILDQLHESRVL